MIQKHMDCIYLDRSEFNTKQVKILGYILCSGVAKCLGKVWQHEHHQAASYTALFSFASLSFYFFLSGCQERILGFRDSLRNNSLQLERPPLPFSRKNLDSPVMLRSTNMNKHSKNPHCVLSHIEAVFFSISYFIQFQLSACLRNRPEQWPQDQLYNLKSSVQNEDAGPLPRKY